MTKLKSTDLINQLRQRPRSGSAELCARLGGINRATLTRVLKTLGAPFVTGGGSRRTRYALCRELRGNPSAIPLFRIDQRGHGHEIGQLSLIYPEGSFLAQLEPFPWPLDQDMNDGWFDSLPYPLIDSRPQGFLGRNFARIHSLDLGVPDNPEAWSDDDVAFVLCKKGHDQPGDLILGEPAYRKFLEDVGSGNKRFLSESEIEAVYLQAANNAMSLGDAGSSAGGEFPKFTSSRQFNSRQLDVIVKFSGADDSPAVRRWSDLLICEHLSSDAMSKALQIEVASSVIHQFGGRTFLEVERFDRHGEFGRSPICTLSSINAAMIGAAGRPWPKLAGELHQSGWLEESDVTKIALIWWFGRLIGNSDMHYGNLAFRPGLKLAPIYDMLPMAYAPLRGGELPNHQFTPELPMPSESLVWKSAAAAAIEFWQTCSGDHRISEGFRKVCARNHVTLQETLTRLVTSV